MITEYILGFLGGVPEEVTVFLLAMLPVGELRGSLPVALVVYDMPVLKGAFISVLGNLAPVYFLLIGFEKVSVWLRAKSEYADQFFEKLFERTRKKLEDSVEKYGVWALALFVAIPLPVTGAWTGTLAAFVFGLDKKQAFWSIAAGLCISAAIVTILTLGTSFTVGLINGN